MSNITFEDINQRIYRLNNSFSNNLTHMQEAQIYTEDGVFCQENAINSIKNWETLDENINNAFEKALDIFDELCVNANSSVLITMTDVLMEGVSKVRDQTQLANSLKYRLSRIKRKITTKINRTHLNVTDKISSAINNFKKPPSNTGVASPAAKPSNTNVTDTAQECYNELYNKCIAIKECDRIINNYNNISRRFNLDNIIDGIRYDNDLYQACYEVASFIDTYRSPFKNKYNSALETTAYLFDKHYMNYPKEKIIQAVTDYFIFSGALKENQISDVHDVINYSVLFNKDDFRLINYINTNDNILKESPIEFINGEEYDLDYNFLLEFGASKELKKEARAKKKELKKAGKQLVKSAKTGNPDERKDKEVHEMIDKFRSDCIKDKDNKNNLSLFKGIVNKIFTKSPEQIVCELPNMLSLIRIVFVLGGTVIHPVIGLMIVIVNGLIKIHLTRKQMDKVIKAYNNEIDSVKNNIEKAKDEKTKENLEKYLEELNKDLKKLEEYERTNYSDEENDERDMEKYASEYDDDDDDWGLDDDWDLDYDDLEEAGRVICISNLMTSISEGLIDTNVDGIVYNNIFKLDNDSIDALTDFSITVPVILEKDKVCESLENYRNQLRGSNTNIKDHIRIDILNENIYKIKNSGPSYGNINNTRDALLYLICLNEIVKLNSNAYLTEMEFANTIKIAINNLKRNAIKLKDKDKQISSSIDIAANNVTKGLEKAVTNDNREAVIRGSIIPSASKCIKIALTVGVAWAINPAVAVIGAIGAFACSKKLQAKERQIILDDIEIELKMCERYIRKAEDDGDMKKVRQMEIMQRNLIRQQQRIKYRMAVVYNQKTPNATSDD